MVCFFQFKKDAGLTGFRYHFLWTGGSLVAVGFLLLVVKCACFRNPLPDEYADDIDDFLSPHGEKKNGSDVPNAVKEVNEEHKDHNHHREPTESEPMQPSVAAAAIAAAAAATENTTNNKLSPS